MSIEPGYIISAVFVHFADNRLTEKTVYAMSMCIQTPGQSRLSCEPMKKPAADTSAFALS